MKKSSLKNYITLLEAAADSATHARDYWMRQHELRDEELLEAKNHIAELERRLDDNGGLERRLDDNGGLCTLRAKLTNETCWEALTRLREVNELKDEELLEAGNYIAELERRLDDNGGQA